MPKIVKILIILVLSVFLLRYMISRFQSDEDRIRKIIEDTAQRTEKKQMFTFMKHFYEKFSDDSGLGAEEIKYMGMRVFQSYKDIRVDYEVNDLQIDSEKKTARFELDLSVTVTDAGQPVDLIHGARKTNTFVVTMEDKGDGWKFIGSRRP